MAEYTTNYVFSLKVEGEDALKEAQRLSDEMQGAFSGFTQILREARTFSDTLKALNTQAKGFGDTLKSLKMGTGLAQEFKAVEQAAKGARAAAQGVKVDPSGFALGGAGMVGTGRGAFDPITGMTLRPPQEFQPYTDIYGITYGGAPRQAPRNLPTPTAGYDPLTMMPSPTVTKPPTSRDMFDNFNISLARETAKLADLRRLGYEMQGIGRTQLAMATAAAGGIALMANEYLQFNEVATRAGMAMEMNSEQMDMLQASLLDGAEAVGAFSAQDLAEGVRLWAAGTGQSVESQSDLNRILSETVSIQQLASMNASNLGETVDHVGGIMHEFGMTTADVNDITAVLNYVAAETFANVGDIGEAFKMVGPIAHSMGMSFEESAAALALLSDQNIKGTMAGRAFRQMLIQMNKPSADYNETMNEVVGLTADMGEAWKEIVFPEGEFEGMAEFIGRLAENLGKVSEAEKNRRLATLATANALPALVSLVNQQIEVQDEGINVLSAFEKAMTGQIDAEVLAYQQWYETTTGLPFSLEGALSKMNGMWETFTQSHTYRVQKMRREWETATIRMGDKFLQDVLPSVEAVVDSVTEASRLLESNPALRTLVTEGIAGGVAMGAGLIGAGYAVQVGADATILLKALKGTDGLLGLLSRAGPVAIGLVGLTAAMTALGKLITDTAAAEEREKQDDILSRFSEEAQQVFGQNFAREFFGGTWLANTEKARELLAQVRGEPVEPTIYPGGDELGTYAFIADIRMNAEEMAAVLRLIAQDLADRERELRASDSRFLDAPSGPSVWTPPRDTRLDPREFTPIEQDIISTWQDYQSDIEQIDADLAMSRKNIWENYNTWYERAQRDLGRSLSRMQDDYLDDEAERIEDHQSRISEINEDALKERAKAQADHDLNLRRMAEDHHDRLIDLIEEGDVRGITKEMGQYRKDKSRAIEDFQREQGERQSDTAERIREQEDSFAKEQQKRQEQYEKRRKDAIEQLELERQDREEDAARETARLEEQAAAEKKILEDKVKDELAILMGFVTGKQALELQALKDAKLFMRLFYDIYEDGLKDILGLLEGNIPTQSPGDLLIDEEAEMRGVDPIEIIREREKTGSGISPDAAELDSSYWMTPEAYHPQTTTREPMVQFTYAPQQTFSGMGAEDKAWYREYTQQTINESYTKLADLVKKGRRGQ